MDILKANCCHDWQARVCDIGGSMEKARTKRSTTIVFIVLTAVFALIMIGAITMLFVNTNKMNSYGTNLEAVYQREYYNLEDDIVNAENKLSKLMASTSGSYQKKLVKEISANAKSAQNSISVLPVSVGGAGDSVRFINQFYGYMTSLETALENQDRLTADQKQKVSELHQSIKEIKHNLNTFSKKLEGGYSILKASKNVDGDFNGLTNDLKQVKTDDIEYPSMIYDGPFSDSVLNTKIKGLNFEEVDQMVAENNLREIYAGQTLENVKYLGQTNGRFKTHDFSFYLDGESQFAQLTINGGKLLTLSGQMASNKSSIDFEQAKTKAMEFTSKALAPNFEIVWSDDENMISYFNFAPVQNGVVLYPDLVKVKVDKSSGNVLGFEACSYYMNHVDRNIDTASISAEQAKANIEKGYNLQTTKLCLVPLDYNREVLCYEFKCNYMDSVFFIYVNAQTGVEENILQVVSSSTGQKLM